MRAFHRALGGDAEVHAWPWGNAEVHAWPWGNAAFGSAAAPREVASFCCKKSHACLLTGGARSGEERRKRKSGEERRKLKGR